MSRHAAAIQLIRNIVLTIQFKEILNSMYVILNGNSAKYNAVKSYVNMLYQNWEANCWKGWPFKTL